MDASSFLTSFTISISFSYLGDLPEDFLKVTEPTASVTSWSEKSKNVKTSEDETSALLGRQPQTVAPSANPDAPISSGFDCFDFRNEFE